MNRKNIHQHIRQVSINTKLNMMAYGIMITFTILIGYLIFSLVSFGNSYNQIVKNVTAANTYNVDLKKDIDYVMYRMIVGRVNSDVVEEEIGLSSPYKIIDEAQEVFLNLADITTGSGNVRRLNRLQKTFQTLEKRVADIDETVEQSGYYDKNMELLEMNIRLLTEIIQESIQEYIYVEAANLETVRLQLEVKQKQAVTLSFFMLIVAALMTSISSFVISRSIAKPIQNLCRTTELVAKGNFSTRAETSYGDEVSILSDSFNSMIEQIGVLVEGIKEEQKNLRVTELKLLQAQINPHFLYNTLDTIVWLAEDEQGQDVVSMVTSLSDFFRNTLSEGRDFVRIQEEEAHIKSYLEIQKYRYIDILEYEIDIADELKEYTILKLTLQPLVENALYHGIKNKRGLGTIKVRGRRKEEDILFTIEDNGIGMDEKTLSNLRQSLKGNRVESGFGLANVDERIRLHYGEKYGLSFESTYGKGTIVHVLIPIIEEQKMIIE